MWLMLRWALMATDAPSGKDTSTLVVFMHEHNNVDVCPDDGIHGSSE